MSGYSDRLNRLFDALRHAAESDIEFSQHDISAHPDRRETKTGFKPVQVSGTEIPSDAGVVFVEGQDERGWFWYVVSSVGGVRREFDVDSRDEAIRAVLSELRAWVMTRMQSRRS